MYYHFENTSALLESVVQLNSFLNYCASSSAIAFNFFVVIFFLFSSTRLSSRNSGISFFPFIVSIYIFL